MAKKTKKVKTETEEQAAGVATTRIALGSDGKTLAEANEIYCQLMEDEFPQLQACMVAARRTWELARGSVCYSSFASNAKFAGLETHVLQKFWSSYCRMLVAFNLLEPIQSLDEQIYVTR
jgi:hypothetical protein